MAIDTPARIAILGAGPIGLETALYARYLGYDVDVFERGRVVENVLRWGHVRMFSPFRMNRSTLGLAAMFAQDEQFRPPGDEELLTGREWAERYLLPLSQSDLIVDFIRERTTVIGIGKIGLFKSDLPGHEDRGDCDFHILVRDEQGRERLAVADAVIDTTGVYGNPNWLGPWGLAAVGEAGLRSQIEYGLPDVLGAERAAYAGRHTLLIGDGYSAATTVVALAQLATEQPGTKVTWITTRECPDATIAPIHRVADDPLTERDRLARAANELAAGSRPDVVHWRESFVTAVSRSANEAPFEVELAGRFAGRHRFDRIVANVGYRPDRTLYEELQVHECYASGGPMKLAAALLKDGGGDCLTQPAGGPEALLNPEPNFYILGAKSYGRKSQFLFATGLEQIRDVFTIIGDRAGLDLYKSAVGLLPQA